MVFLPFQSRPSATLEFILQNLKRIPLVSSRQLRQLRPNVITSLV
jgi:hypothetical protein